MSEIRLARGRGRRVAAGHPWVFSNEIEAVDPQCRPGSVVKVLDSRRRLIGRGVYNPASQIAVRLFTWADEDLDAAFVAGRIEAAMKHRLRFLSDASACRVVFAEADGLPGLVVDRFADVLVVQFLALAAEVFRNPALDALDRLFRPRGIFVRNDAPVRDLEGLPREVGWARGNGPTEVVIRENGLEVEVDFEHGQKTGYFLDQRDNRNAIRPLCHGARVLDVFCHTGGFALNAAAGGARSVLGVDASEEALRRAGRNSERNGFDPLCRFETANAFDRLRELDKARERFDVVVLDPPAFAKNQAALEGAVRGYKEINLRGIRLLRPGGFLVTCSCSHHMPAELLLDVVRDAAADAGRRLWLLEQRGQPPDHPVLLAAPETAYLKCFFFRILG